MNKQIVSVLFLFMVMGCSTHGRINLTPEGGKVAYVGKDFVANLPGKPLDRCTILGHLNLSPAYDAEEQFKTLQMDSIVPALKNETARHGGNCVIFTGVTFKEAFHAIDQIDGIMLSCPEDILKAAGLRNIVIKTIRADEMIRQ